MSLKTLLSILLLAGVVAAAAQEEPAGGAEAAADGEEPEVDPIVALTQPGEHHDHLDRLVGEWDLTIHVWQSPDGEPIEAAGSAEARWILDRRFLWTIYRTELFGRPFEAWSIEGYDNQAKEYVGTWRDTQGTYTLIYRGKCKQPPRDEDEDEDESEVEPVPEGTFREMKSKLTDPASGEKLDVRTELRIQEDGSGFVYESFIDLPDEESIKNLEIVGVRRAG